MIKHQNLFKLKVAHVPKVWAITLAALCLCSPTATFAQPAPQEDHHREKWDLTDLYSSEKLWENTFKAAQIKLDKLSKFKGTIKDAKSLLTVLNAASHVREKTAKLYAYASLRHDENLANITAQDRLEKIASLIAHLEEDTAFIQTQIILFGKSNIEKFIVQQKGLNRHAFFMRNALRLAPHRKPKFAGTTATRRAGTAPSPLATAKIKWPTILLASGEAAHLNVSGYAFYRKEAFRADRQTIFERFWTAVKKHEALIGSAYTARIKAQTAEAKNRAFTDSSVPTLAASLETENIPKAVYIKLITAANHLLPTFHKHLRLRQKALKLPNLAFYDLYAPRGAAQQHSLEDAKNLLIEAVTPLGNGYKSILQRGLYGNWMHSYPSAKKRSGAYMQDAAYGVHPFILLNYDGGLQSLSTFAHEWGHAAHSVLAARHNLYETSKYGPFIAEVSSTTSELFLHNELLDNAVGISERIAALQQALATFEQTFFQQALFAEFELAAHNLAQFATLSGAELSALYLKLLRKYYGHHEGVMHINALYGIGWATASALTHPYNAFKYATSLAGAALFTEQIGHGNVKMQADFLSTLSAGGSDYPYTLLKKAGVDLATNVPYDALSTRMKLLLDELEVLLERN
ncbi:MAG: hypothetical protein JKY34_16110 [Kordiimonadaceae bacterium]|nr:hypothetical protein [Kordiimonadaceae bacterium]